MIGHLDRAARDGRMRLEEMGVGYGAFRECFENRAFTVGEKRFGNELALPSGGLFLRCTFIRCGFTGPMRAQFSYCRLIDCNFLCGNPEGRIEQQELQFQWCELNGGVLERREGVFSHVRLTRSRFENCRLSRIGFIYPTEFEGVRFHQKLGLPSCRDLEQVRVLSEDSEVLDGDLRATPLGILDRVASWERLRTFGRLPLFGTSLTALVAIPTVFFLLAVHNEQLARLQERAAGGDASGRLRELVGALQPIPVPSLSLWLLLSTLLLGIASTLFALLCPSRVREFSLDRWTDELRHSALRYLPGSWNRRWARAVAAPCYLIGGGGTAIILLIKLWNAAGFILRNSASPW